jgi:hypothetical protein
MSDSDFWRDLAERFRAADPQELLRADWHQQVKLGEQEPMVAQWRIVGADRRTRSIQLEFEALARRGGPKIYPQMDSLTGWLEALRQYRLNVENQTTAVETGPDGKIIAHIYIGSIGCVRQASVDLCKLLESRTLETEHMESLHEQQKEDPKNWSPLRQHWETLKAIKHLVTGHHEEISEALVRSVLAEQYGVKPDEVTWKQIQFEVAGLLTEYPAIRLIPLQPAAGATEDLNREVPGAEAVKTKGDSEVKEEAIAPAGDGKIGSRSGRKPDADGNRRVANVVKRFSPNWRDRLPEVCEALDEENMPLPKSDKWKNRGCSDWTDVLTEDPEGLAKALQHRLDWVSEHPLDGPHQQRG